MITCPEVDCAAAFMAIGSLDELEALVCDCGCTLTVERLMEHDGELREGATFELVMLG
jgi:hypothetical protein